MDLLANKAVIINNQSWKKIFALLWVVVLFTSEWKNHFRYAQFVINVVLFSVRALRIALFLLKSKIFLSEDFSNLFTIWNKNSSTILAPLLVKFLAKA